MNYTENYQLPQWEESDRVLMADFNAMTAKLEAGLTGKADAADLAALTAAVPKITAGTYIGTGQYGISHPNTLTFPFVPKLVVIQEKATGSSNSGAILIYGQESCTGIVTAHGLALTVSWEGKSLSWYTSQDYPQYQLNTNTQTYYYLAIG